MLTFGLYRLKEAKVNSEYLISGRQKNQDTDASQKPPSSMSDSCSSALPSDVSWTVSGSLILSFTLHSSSVDFYQRRIVVALGAGEWALTASVLFPARSLCPLCNWNGHKAAGAAGANIPQHSCPLARQSSRLHVLTLRCGFRTRKRPLVTCREAN